MSFSSTHKLLLIHVVAASCVQTVVCSCALWVLDFADTDMLLFHMLLIDGLVVYFHGVLRECGKLPNMETVFWDAIYGILPKKTSILFITAVRTKILATDFA
jgi:hypothetical protein